MRLQVVFAFAVVLLVAGSAGASSNGSQASATASAYGVKVVPGGSSTAVSAPPNAVGFTSGYAYPSDGSVITTGSISASASTASQPSRSASTLAAVDLPAPMKPISAMFR
jgi:hypothetical protein